VVSLESEWRSPHTWINYFLREKEAPIHLSCDPLTHSEASRSLRTLSSSHIMVTNEEEPTHRFQCVSEVPTQYPYFPPPKRLPAWVMRPVLYGSSFPYSSRKLNCLFYLLTQFPLVNFDLPPPPFGKGLQNKPVLFGFPPNTFNSFVFSVVSGPASVSSSPFP